MTNDLRDNCPQCLQHYQKIERVVAPASPPERDGDTAEYGGGGNAKAAADPAVGGGQPQRQQEREKQPWSPAHWNHWDP